MKQFGAQRIADAAAATLLRGDGNDHGRTGDDRGAEPTRTERADGPARAVISSREAGPETLFVGLPGTAVHGGSYAPQALAAGAWGVLTSPEYATAALAASDSGVVLAADDPLAALQRLARAWRRQLGAQVIGVTGSTGKTSTKDLLSAVLGPQRRTVVSQANFNTEIGLPLQILAAPAGTEVLVLEMGMRGRGQIAELAAIAEPDVGVIVSIGPVHLELLGTIENIAAAKAELIAALPAGATAVIPAAEPLLDPHLRDGLNTVTFGPGGDVTIVTQSDDSVELDLDGEHVTVAVNFTQAHLRSNLLAAAAAAKAVGVTVQGPVELELTPGRGQLIELQGGIRLLDGSYNGNPTSMRSALTELDTTAGRAGGHARPPARRVAVLGDMLELGPEAPHYHREIGAYADGRADLLVTVGPLAAHMNEAFSGESHHVADAQAAGELLPTLLRDGDLVLVKGSLGVGLKRVCETLIAGAQT